MTGSSIPQHSGLATNAVDGQALWFWHNWGAVEAFWILVRTGDKYERPGANY